MLLNTFQPRSYLESVRHDSRVLRAEVLGSWGKQILGGCFASAFVLTQLTGAGRTDTGLLVMTAILLLMLMGGILLVVRGISDFLQDRKAARRENETDKRKAA